MYAGKTKNLSEVCPQCCKLVDSSAYRLVHDTCGHLKCRICLLQEITGCLLCSAGEKSTFVENTSNNQTDNTHNLEHQQRKSVITSVAIQIAEQNFTENPKCLSSSLPSVVDKDTCHLIKQSLEKDILFPTDIVKRSTGNFYHLKRVFSQRFFSENTNNKKHKACETEEKWSGNQNIESKASQENTFNGTNWKLPSHIQVQYYCTVHKIVLEEKNVLKDHMACSCEGACLNSLYKCKLCAKEYKVLSKLNRHMKVHTKNSKFKCGSCGKSCIDNYALKAHERTHTDIKPYSCSLCDKKFSGLQNFKRHEMKHKNLKKFVCDECGFKFITRTELKRHSMTHTNVKLFACKICSSRFSFKRTLIRHTRTHDSNLIKLKCTQCESTFKRKDNLERHVKSAHVDMKQQHNNVQLKV